MVFERKIKTRKYQNTLNPMRLFETECRTLNPGKNQLGLLSKVILERIVNDIRKISELTQ